MMTSLTSHAGGDNARVPEETIWRQADPDLPLYSVPVTLHFHQNLSRHLFWGHIYQHGLGSGSVPGHLPLIGNHWPLHNHRGLGGCDLHGHFADGNHAGGVFY
ncbi:unnamed protein product, partial [Gulo gulo]